MHPRFADGALPLQVGVGLARMAATPRQWRLFCSGTLCGRGNGGWFPPALDEDQVDRARGMSLRKVSYEAFVFSVFSRNQEKTKPLTWLSVSSEALQSL